MRLGRTNVRTDKQRYPPTVPQSVRRHICPRFQKASGRCELFLGTGRP